jgi:hypothetical protein
LTVWECEIAKIEQARRRLTRFLGPRGQPLVQRGESRANQNSRMPSADGLVVERDEQVSHTLI